MLKKRGDELKQLFEIFELNHEEELENYHKILSSEEFKEWVHNNISSHADQYTGINVLKYSTLIGALWQYLRHKEREKIKINNKLNPIP